MSHLNVSLAPHFPFPSISTFSSGHHSLPVNSKAFLPLLVSKCSFLWLYAHSLDKSTSSTITFQYLWNTYISTLGPSIEFLNVPYTFWLHITKTDNNNEILAIKLFLLYHILNDKWHHHSHKQARNLVVNLNFAIPETRNLTVISDSQTELHIGIAWEVLKNTNDWILYFLM